MTTPPQAQVAALPESPGVRSHVVKGSAILLLSTGLVAGSNLLYNIGIARMLGAAGFGHASALYTLLMLTSALTLSFQLVTSKFIARTNDADVRAQIYAKMLKRAWQVGLATGAVLAVSSGYLQTYFNLPEQHDLVMLGIAAGVYIPLGVRRGRMQGDYDFRGLAINVVVEVGVKLGGALLFLYLRMGVTGVMTAILMSIVAAYLVSSPGKGYRKARAEIRIAPFGEGMQAITYFIGQVILSNLDILLVKHFFASSEAGIYAGVALVGRVVFMLSWSVVSSMFPISARHAHRPGGRSVLYTALALVGVVTSVFIAAVALAPEVVWTGLLGRQFLLATSLSFSTLLTQYAVMTGVYSMAVVIMMYEISRRIGTAAWVQLGASLGLAIGIWIRHDSLSQVIFVQFVIMCALLVVVTVPLFRKAGHVESVPATAEPLHRLRPVAEDEVIAEFLRGEFYHPDFDPYRHDFRHLVEHSDLENPQENFIRRALLFRRRGRLWREIPEDTEWWELELSAHDLSRLRSFPRNDWRRFAGRGFYLREMIGRIEAELLRGKENRFLKKIGAVASDLRANHVPDAVLLIGIDEHGPLTIIEGNHRMAAAMLIMPEMVHHRFRFYCGFSANMNLCCWYKTDLRSLMRYGRHSLRYMFRDGDFFIARTLQEKLAEMEPS
jgi:O-antigen/teichoic acid export membrane protein